MLDGNVHHADMTGVVISLTQRTEDSHEGPAPLLLRGAPWNDKRSLRKACELVNGEGDAFNGNAEKRLEYEARLTPERLEQRDTSWGHRGR